MTVWMRNVNVDSEADGFSRADLDQDGWTFWSCWRQRQWPFNHVNQGDGILLVETWLSPARGSRIGWYGRLQPLLTEPYGSRAELLQLLGAQFGLDEDAVASEPYTVDKPDEGYVIGFQVKPLHYVGVSRPAEVRLRPNGWRGTDDLDPALVAAWTQASAPT